MCHDCISFQIFYKKNNERNTTRLEKTERDGPTCKRPRGKGKGTTSKPKPIHKEPGMHVMYFARIKKISIYNLVLADILSLF